MMKNLVSFSNSSQSAPSENSGLNVNESSDIAQKPKRKGCYVCGCIVLVPVFLILLGIIGAMFSDVSETGKSGNQPSNAKPEHVWQSDSDAYLCSEEFVKKGLKSPSTAEFPDYSMGVPDMSVIKVFNHRDDTYTVVADVDAQNSFGAMLRSRYVCKMYCNPKTGDWTLISLKFIE